MSKHPTTAKKPHGELAIRMLAMPAHTNPNGDIFGGWVVSMMDLAGASFASKYAPRRVTTVAIDSIVFISPVKVGDCICCYADLVKIGRTSIVVEVQTWASAPNTHELRQVTAGIFTYVAIDEQGRPEPALRID